MSIQIPVGVRVRYKLENVHPVTGRRTPLSGWSDNIMLTVGLNIMADRSDWFSWVQVGTSNVEPNASQTTLQGWVAGTDNIIDTTQGAQPAPGPYYGWKRRIFRYEPGDIPGSSGLNEVALGWGEGAAGAEEIISRARIVDINGDFTTPTPDPTEFLDVTAEVRVQPPTVDVTGSEVINGVTYDYTLRAANATSTESWASQIGSAMSQKSDTAADWKAFEGNIGTIDSEPSGLSADCDNANQFNYAYANLSNTLGMGCNCGPTGWNLAGEMRSLRFRTTYGDYQIQFVATDGPNVGGPIPKTTGFTMFFKFDLTWAEGTIV